MQGELIDRRPSACITPNMSPREKGKCPDFPTCSHAPLQTKKARRQIAVLACEFELVAGKGVEPLTRGFSVPCSTN